MTHLDTTAPPATSHHATVNHWKPTTAGLAALVAGALSLLGAAVLAILALVVGGAFTFADELDTAGGIFGFASALLVFGVCAVFCAILGGIAIKGGLETLNRGSYGWALVGSVVTMIVFFPVGILAVVLVIVAEDEFRAASRADRFGPSAVAAA